MKQLPPTLEDLAAIHRRSEQARASLFNDMLPIVALAEHCAPFLTEDVPVLFAEIERLRGFEAALDEVRATYEEHLGRLEARVKELKAALP